MTFDSDLQSDLSSDLDAVFFDDFAVNCLLVRSAEPVDAVADGIRCLIETGVERFTGDGYVKNSWEATVKAADRVRKGDTIQALDNDGLVERKYLVGHLAAREGDVLIYSVEKIK